MTREEAIKCIRDFMGQLTEGCQEALKSAIPELAESEDERIRKRLIEYFEGFRIGNAKVKWEGLTVQDVLDWLEKQKGLDKMIVVSPEVWDEAIADAYENGKKDGEKQRGQKVDIDKEKLIRHCIGLILTDATDERFKDYGLTLKDCLTWLGEQKEQKPAEWSKEDERIRKAILGFVNPDKGGTKYSSYAELVEWSNWLKSLRPSWKPSEEQLRPLEYAIDYFKKKRNDTTYLESLYNDLKKL